MSSSGDKNVLPLLPLLFLYDSSHSLSGEFWTWAEPLLYGPDKVLEFSPVMADESRETLAGQPPRLFSQNRMAWGQHMRCVRYAGVILPHWHACLSCLSSSRKEISQLPQLKYSFPCINGWGDSVSRVWFPCTDACFESTSLFALVRPSRLRAKSKAWLFWWLGHLRGHWGVEPIPSFCCLFKRPCPPPPQPPRESVELQVKCCPSLVSGVDGRWIGKPSKLHSCSTGQNGHLLGRFERTPSYRETSTLHSKLG